MASSVGDFVTCPYNNSHKLLAHKMQHHIVRCRRGLPPSQTAGKLTCPFNATHIIDEGQMAQHTNTCPSRKDLDAFKYQVGNVSVPKPVAADPIENENFVDENWDEEENYPSYNPEATIAANKNLLVTKKGARPSEKKRFREERRKLHLTADSVKTEEYGFDEYDTYNTPGTSHRKEEVPVKDEEESECGAEPFEYGRKVPHGQRVAPPPGFSGKGRGSPRK